MSSSFLEHGLGRDVHMCVAAQSISAFIDNDRSALVLPVRRGGARAALPLVQGEAVLPPREARAATSTAPTRTAKELRTPAPALHPRRPRGRAARLHRLQLDRAHLPPLPAAEGHAGAVMCLYHYPPPPPNFFFFFWVASHKYKPTCETTRRRRTEGRGDGSLPSNRNLYWSWKEGNKRTAARGCV